MEDRTPMANVREAYARWWFACEAADVAFDATPESKDAEDLGDFQEAMHTLRSFGPNPRAFPEHPYPFDGANWLAQVADAHSIRMTIKRLITIAREEFPEFDFVGEVDDVDVTIEALIHPEAFEVKIRTRS